MGSHSIDLAAGPVLARPSAEPQGVSRTLDAEVRVILDGVRRIVRVLRLTAGEAERSLRLSAAQLFVLEQLAQGPAESLEALARRTLTDQSSVSVVVGRLLESGLVSRRRSPEDGRRVVLALTAKGRALVARAPRTGQAQLIRVLSELSDGERRGLALGLGALSARLQPGGGAPPMFFEEPAASGPARASQKPKAARPQRRRPRGKS